MTTLFKSTAEIPPGTLTEGTPRTPGTPAYCTTQTVPVVTYSERLLHVIQNPNGSYTVVPPGTAGAILIVQPATSIRYETRTVCYPAVEATPGTPPTLTDAQRFNFGWDGGARSAAALTGDGSASFSVSLNTVGAVVGFNDVNTGPGFLEIDHGFYFASGYFRVRERGVNQTAAVAFSESDVFRIVRSGSTVRYYQGTDLVHTSSLPSYGDVFLDASLYAGGDAVLDAALEASIPSAITPTGRASGSFSLYAYGGDESSVASGSFSFSGEATGVVEQGGIARLTFSGLGGDYSGGQGSGTFSFSGDGSDIGHDTPAFSGGMAFLSFVGSGVSETRQGAVRPYDSLTDASQMWEPNTLDGLVVYIVSGTGSGQSRTIATNNQHVLFTATNWTTNPDDTSVYEIRDGSTVLYSGYVDGFDPQYTPSFYGLAADAPYAGAYGAFSFSGSAFDAEPVQGWALLTLSEPFSVRAIGRQVDPNGFDGEMPRPTLTAYGDARARMTMPAPTLSASGTVQRVGQAELVMPSPTLTASGIVGGVGRANLTLWDRFSLTAFGDCRANLSWDDAPQLTAEGEVGHVGQADLTLQDPFVVVARASQANFGVANLTVPLILVPLNNGVARLTAPSAQLLAEGGPTTTAGAGDTWVMNLANQAVTRYTGFEFKQFIRLGSHYYGVADDGLYRIGGLTDDGTDISWSVKTGATDFGTRKLKRAVSAYFGARMGTSMTVTVHALEQGSWSYAYTNPRGALPQNYRVQFGRGFNDRYYAIGLSGTKAVEVDEMDLEVVTQGGSL